MANRRDHETGVGQGKGCVVVAFKPAAVRESHQGRLLPATAEKAPELTPDTLSRYHSRPRPAMATKDGSPII